MNLPECGLPKTHKEIVRIMVFSIPCLKDGQATSNTKARAPLPGFSRVIWDEWGKKGVRMDTKALKKQMGAAIAMVLVAAVALGSATFAWFVTNNKVDATTSTISAQSNAAFMTITNGETGASKVNTKTASTNITGTAADGSTPLYPATFGEQGQQGAYVAATKGKFMTGFGADLDDGTLSSNLDFVKGTSGEAGSYEAATTGKYAIAEYFNVSSKGQDLKELKVDGVTVAEGSSSTSSLKQALRILVTSADGTVWDLYGLNAGGTAYERKLSSDPDNHAVNFGTVKAGQDTALKVYLFYEGSDVNVKTTNLQNGMLSATNAVTITFTATADNK